MQTDYSALIAEACADVESGGICRLHEDCRPELGGCSRCCQKIILRGAIVGVSRVDVYREDNVVSFTMADAEGCRKSTPCRIYLKGVEVAIHD